VHKCPRGADDGILSEVLLPITAVLMLLTVFQLHCFAVHLTDLHLRKALLIFIWRTRFVAGLVGALEAQSACCASRLNTDRGNFRGWRGRQKFILGTLGSWSLCPYIDKGMQDLPLPGFSTPSCLDELPLAFCLVNSCIHTYTYVEDNWHSPFTLTQYICLTSFLHSY
jgi:hypothetical protein